MANKILFSIVGVFFLYPLARLFLLSVQTDQGFGFVHFIEIVQDPQTWSALQNTLAIGIGSTILTLVIGFGLAWVCAYTDIRHKGWIRILALLPFIIPSYVTTLAWTQLAGPAGVINKLAAAWLGTNTVLCNVYSLPGMILVMGLTHYPLVYLMALSVLYRIPRDLEWAARSSGAGQGSVFWQITCRLAVPGLTAGGVLAFISSLDNFGIPAFLGIPARISVLSTLIYEQVTGLGPSAFAKASALSVLLGLVALAGTSVQWLLLKKGRATDASAEDKSVRFHLGRKRPVVEWGIWIFFAVTSVAPLLAMLSTALTRAYGLSFTLENLTFSHFLFVLKGNEASGRAIANSLVLAGLTTLVCVVVGTAFSYWRIHRADWLAKLLEGAISLPYAVPGIVLGLSVILACLQPLPNWNFGVYGTIWILLIAYCLRFMILEVRSSLASILQIGPEMEEAARIHGGSLLVRWQKILVPLYLPGIVSGAFLVFLMSLTEFTLSSLLWSTGSETIGVIIFSFEQAGATVNSTAFSTLLVLVIVAAVIVGELFRQRFARRVQGEK